MSNYIITQYSYDKAKQLNLIIKQSKNKNKKIDVVNSKQYLSANLLW